ncbi:MAG: glycosyltransferase [Solirubrobacterales bacterium]|nr:glycosyltransferase [Solirubrobacterales bacterium]
MTPPSTSRVDLHCHSTASVLSRLGVQTSLGLPECATPPEDVFELAIRRGMDFVTLTDHDTIDGALAIADDPRVFVSEELSVAFKGEPQAVHVLCWDITPDDHEWLQAHNGDVERCAAYLHEGGIANALAHPFFTVGAPLAPRHRRRLAELFPVWETRNGARAQELNAPAAIYVETHGGTGVGGSDDHAGVDIGRTATETPAAATPQEFLAHVRAGRARPVGEEGSAAKWAHAAMGLAVRALGPGAPGSRPDPQAVWRIVERIMRDGHARSGPVTDDLSADDARALLAAWLHAAELDLGAGELLAHLQADGFSHAELFGRARGAHVRRLARVAEAVGVQAEAASPDLAGLADGLYDACLAVIPYVPATAFLGKEKTGLARDRTPAKRPRVALMADGIGTIHGVSGTVAQLRRRGVPGCDVDVIGTDSGVDRRLDAVVRIAVPSYAGLELGVPGLPDLVEVLADGDYDLVHVTAPGPCGVAALAVARVLGLPVVGSYHTELAAYAGARSADPDAERLVGFAVAAFYGQCARVLSPSPHADASLRAMGVSPERLGRWDRGVDLARFGPERRVSGLLPDRVNVLYAGRLTTEKGIDLLAESFLAARRQDPRLHLVLAGGGAEEGRLRELLGEHATFLGWLEGDALARAYASADIFLFASRTDTFGQVLLEAQASGLPVVAVAQGGPCSLIEDGRTGVLCPPTAEALAHAVVGVAGNRLLRDGLARAALAAVRERTWQRSFEALAAGYDAVLGAGDAGARRTA